MLNTLTDEIEHFYVSLTPCAVGSHRTAYTAPVKFHRIARSNLAVKVVSIKRLEYIATGMFNIDIVVAKNTVQADDLHGVFLLFINISWHRFIFYSGKCF